MRRSRQGSLLRTYFFSPGHAQLASLTDFLFHTTPLGSLVAGWGTRANSDTLHVNDDQRSLMCMQQLHLQCNPFFRPLVYRSVLVLHHFFKVLFCFVSCLPFFVLCFPFSVRLFESFFQFSLSLFVSISVPFSVSTSFSRFFLVVLIQVTRIGILFRSRRTWMSKGAPSTEWRHAKLPDVVRRLPKVARLPETFRRNLELQLKVEADSQVELTKVICQVH